MSARGGALVTGAGRGLGREIALALAARGHAVHVTDVDGEAAAAVAAQCGGASFASVLDVRDGEACRAAARDTAARAGGLDVWVNNAGILPTGYGWEQDEAHRRLAFEINALGTINGTLAALELMRPLGSGQVVNVVSLAGLAAAPGQTLYSATKHAAIAFSIGTQADLHRSGERGIHVSALCPDGIWTPMLHEKVDDPEAAASWTGVLLQPADVARRAVQLLDHPKPVAVMPRWRSPVLRFYDAVPGLGIRLLPLVMADARRRQRRWKARNTV